MTNLHTFNIIPFSTKLAIIRTARGLNQYELAEKLGIDKTLISRYERGLQPSPSKIEEIEKALNVEFDHPDVENALRVLIGTELAIAA